MTRRRRVTAVVLLVVMGAAPPTVADEVLTRAVACTATRAHLLTANPNRLTALVANVGTLHVNVGRGDTMFALHVGSSLALTPGYLGGLDCQTGGGSSVMELFEDVR